MATLRLFAGLRDAAGTSKAQIEGATVAEVIDTAVAQFGPGFAEGVPRARVWLNGEEASPSDPVSPEDEVALLPPVSGGSTRLISAPPAPDLVLPGLVALALVLGNVAGDRAWWAAAVVALAALWAGDVASTVASRGGDLPVLPALVSILVAAVAVHLLGPLGFAFSLVAAVVTTLAWGVASDSSRMLRVLSPAMITALVAASSVASLMLSRTVFVPEGRATGLFLVVVLAATAIGMFMERLSGLPFGDPFSATALGAVAAALITAAIWELDLVAFLIAGLALTVALVAGRTLGSLLRTRDVLLLDRAPGMMTVLDGAVLAGAVYLPVLLLVTP